MQQFVTLIPQTIKKLYTDLMMLDQCLDGNDVAPLKYPQPVTHKQKLSIKSS